MLRHLIAAYDYQLKFVVSSPEDLPEIETMLREIGADRGRVMLMAEGTDPGAIQERARWLVDVCRRQGFRYSPRLHIDIWGNRRGV